MIRQLVVTTAWAALLTACSQGEPESSSFSRGLDSGIAVENFDHSVRPGDDFYRYVNGTWLANTGIPPDRSNHGVFTILSDRAEENLLAIIEEAMAENNPQGSDAQKVGDLYRSFMDQETVDALGAEPLYDILQEIIRTDSRQNLLMLTARLNRIGVQIPAAAWVDVDAMQSDRYVTYISQSGLGLPDRDWYLSTDNAAHSTAREAYHQYIDEVMELAGYGDSERVAQSVFSIEYAIAQAHWDRVRNRQRELTYNRMTVDELNQLAPDLDWSGLLTALGSSESTVVVRQPDYIEALGSIWEQHTLTAWQDYYSFKLVDAYAPYLSDDFVQARFNLRGRTLSGTDELRPRWKRGVALVENTLGEVLGRLYVERHFQEASRQRMQELVANLREAFRVGIDNLAWMSSATKAEARDKLSKFTTKIGYPDTWKDYSEVEVTADDLVGNIMRSRQVEHDRDMNRLGQPIDRDEWFMTPQTVNAYYNPPMNEIVFPAGILQPPFFNVDADDAVNYGAIGAVIGHELSHGFDDQGRKSDGDGNLRDWWTEEDAQAFAERADAVVQQYSQFEVLPGKFLDGEFTLGENIGDLSGLAVAFEAWQMSLEGEAAPVIDGFSGEQRFFIGWAQSWRRLYRDADLETRLTSDPHAHSEARTNGVVRNFDSWYEAFDVLPDDALYLPPQERVRIW